MALRRLQIEYAMLLKDPVPNCVAHPSPKNNLKWHYLIHSLEDSVYEGGFYHGTITFPNDYPHRPPAIRMKTPSGRFVPNQRLCFSMSDYHPETWQPSWRVSSILIALISFMNGSQFTAGAMRSSDRDKRIFAKNSMDFNMKDKEFVELFAKDLQKIKQKQGQLPSKEESQGLASQAFYRRLKPEEKNKTWIQILKIIGFSIISLGVVIVAYEIAKPLD